MAAVTVATISASDAYDQKKMEELVTGKALETLILEAKYAERHDTMPAWRKVVPTIDVVSSAGEETKSAAAAAAWCLDASRQSLKHLEIQNVHNGYEGLVERLSELFPNLETVKLRGIRSLIRSSTADSAAVSMVLFSGLTKLRVLEIDVSLDSSMGVMKQMTPIKVAAPPEVQELIESHLQVYQELAALLLIIEEHKETLRELGCPFSQDWCEQPYWIIQQMSEQKKGDHTLWLGPKQHLLFNALSQLCLTKLGFNGDLVPSAAGMLVMYMGRRLKEVTHEIYSPGDEVDDRPAMYFTLLSQADKAAVRKKGNLNLFSTLEEINSTMHHTDMVGYLTEFTALKRIEYSATKLTELGRLIGLVDEMPKIKYVKLRPPYVGAAKSSKKEAKLLDFFKTYLQGVSLELPGFNDREIELGQQISLARGKGEQLVPTKHKFYLLMLPTVA
jgi:hypothetical protein